MMTKIAGALLLSSAMLAPGFSSAQDTSLLEKSFPNRGVCESNLKQLRNDARKAVQERTGGQISSLVNRLGNPGIKFFCTAISQDGQTVFKIVEG